MATDRNIWDELQGILVEPNESVRLMSFGSWKKAWLTTLHVQVNTDGLSMIAAGDSDKYLSRMFHQAAQSLGLEAVRVSARVDTKDDLKRASRVDLISMFAIRAEPVVEQTDSSQAGETH